MKASYLAVHSINLVNFVGNILVMSKTLNLRFASDSRIPPTSLATSSPRCGQPLVPFFVSFCSCGRLDGHKADCKAMLDHTGHCLVLIAQKRVAGLDSVERWGIAFGESGQMVRKFKQRKALAQFSGPNSDPASTLASTNSLVFSA